jgi:putative Mn2+ efflux pump MntP
MNSLPLYEVLIISIGLGSDAFSVALAAGAQGFAVKRVFRLSWHFGSFQFMMPIIGWGLGEIISQWIGRFANWVMFALLIVIGGKMIWEGIKDTPKEIPDLSRGWTLVILSVATSLDALGVGFGFGLLGYAILKPAIIVGVVCSMMTVIGLYLGAILYDKLGRRAIIIGGIILIGIGIKMIV